MKIIQFIFRLGSGGAEVFVASLSRKLVELGHDVQILTLFKESDNAKQIYEPILGGRVPIHRLDFDQGFSFKKVKAVCDYIKSVNPNIVHCHLNVIPYIYPIAIRERRIKYYHTLHSVADHVGTKGITRLLARWFYQKQLIKPIAISRLCAQSFKDVYRMSDICTIYNGCAEMKPTMYYDDVSKEIDSYKLSSNTTVFIHVARFDKLKRQDVLVRVFNRLFNEGTDFILLIIGREFDTRNAKPLVDNACKSIHFLGQKGNVADYLNCSDAFCLTSDYEGLPISLLEAFSAGVTPICTPVGGIPDVVIDSETGYLSDDKTASSYYYAIKRYLNNPIDKSKLVRLFYEKYTIDVCAKEYLKLFT